MPSVPTYDQPRVQQQGFPNVRVQANAPLEAFGGGQSAAAASAATGGVASELGQIADSEKQKADQVAFMTADRQASELQTQLQVNSAKMQGKDALGAPEFVQQGWQQGMENIQKGLSNDSQRMAFAKASNSRYEELNKHVQVHVGQQMQAFDDQETQGYIESSRNAAVLNAHDDSRIQDELDRQTLAYDAWATRHGIPKDSGAYQSKLAENLSATHKGIIAARLDDGDVKSAQEYMEGAKGQMTSSDILHANKLIENGEVTTEGLASWSKVKSMTLADGTPDEERMRQSVMADTDLSDKRKEKVWAFVKARAGEFTANKNREEAANDRDFMNQVLQARKQGAPLDDAMKLVGKFGDDDYDQSMKTAAVQKVYAPPSQSDPGTFINLWEKVQNSESSKTDIDKAFQENRINTADWRKLREDYFKSNSDGKDPLEKAQWERIKALADEKFGSNKLSKESFMYELHVDGRNKSPEEIWKAANDKLKGNPETGVWGFFQTPQWKTRLQQMDAQNMAWGKAYEDLGKNETVAIGQGTLYSGKKSWGLSDLDSFAQTFGGYDKIKPGTPVHNAVQSLMKRQELATPSNIKAVLDRFTDGRF